MNRYIRSASLALPFLLGAVISAQGATAPASPTTADVRPPPPPALKPITLADGSVTLEFIERFRVEDRTNNFDFDDNAHSPTDDSWFVQRFRAGLTWKPQPGVSAQLQFQDAREWSSERPNVPFILGSEGNDAFDLRLASLTFGDPKTSKAVATFGRQTLALGDERLVGVGEWNNFARTFDAAKVIWNITPGETTATLFVSSVVHVEGTSSGDGWSLNHSSTDDIFSGFYLSHKLPKAGAFEAYALRRDKKDSTPIYTAPTAPIPAAARSAAAYDIGQNILTIGARYLMPPPAKGGGFDTEIEGAYQWGNVDRQTTTATGPYGGTSPSLDHRAWALHTMVGYTPADAPWKPRLSLEYNLASGDTDRTDGTNESFMNLFPSNHKWYGFMDLFAWKNLREAVGTVRFSPVSKTTVRIDYHLFSLYSSRDAWYRANGVATVRPLNAAAQNAPRRAGDELDITFTWAARPWATIDLGWSHFSAGAYLGATGARSDAEFIYAQTTFRM